MGALDQFSKFCAMIAGGITGARPAPAHEPTDSDREQDAPASTQRTTPPAPRPDDNRQAASGSHPAVWPR
jgi:hypothetical protein